MHVSAPEQRQESDFRKLGGRLAGNDGFTMIETLAAAVVLAIGILGTVTVFSSADQTTVDAELQQIATDQAERAIEQVRSLDYAQLGHTTTPVLPAGETGLSGNNYQSPDASGSEQLVTAANSESGDPKYSSSSCGSEDTSGAGGSTATACFKIGSSAFPQNQTFTVTQGGGQTVTGHIYTLVTWRDEECEALPITTIRNLFGSSGPTSSLYNLLQARLTALNSLLTSLNALNALLPNAAKTLKNTTIPALQTLIGQVQTQLNTLDSRLNSLTTLDLCDLRSRDAAALLGLLETNSSSGAIQLNAAITSPLAASASLSTQTSGVQTALNALGGVSCILLPGSPLCTALTSASTTLNTTITGAGGTTVNLTDVKDKLTTLNADLAGATANTTHNTKRVTVAVTIDKSRAGLTPSTVVYLSTIVTDPNDGLLG